MGFLDSMEGFWGDDRKRAGFSGQLMGLAQGLLSQRRGENWGSALGRGFGQAGYMKSQRQGDYDKNEQRLRSEAEREYASDMLARDEANPNPSTKLSESQRHYWRRIAVGGDDEATNLSGAAFAQLGQAERQDVKGKQDLANIGASGDQTVRGIEAQGQVGSRQIGENYDNQKDYAAMKQAYQRANMGLGDDITRRQMGLAHRQNLDQLGVQQDYRTNNMGLNQQFNLESMGVEADLASAARFEDHELKERSAENQFDRGLEGHLTMGEREYGWGKRTDEDRHQLNLDAMGWGTNEEIFRQRELNPILAERGEDAARTGYMYDAKRMADEQEDRLELAEVDHGYKRSMVRIGWSKELHMQQFTHGLRTKEMHLQHKLGQKTEMEMMDKAQEFRVAEMEMMRGFEAASAMEGQSRINALRQIYADRVGNESLSDAMREDASRVMNLDDEQLQAAVYQERQLQAQIMMNQDARAERGADASNAARIREKSKRNYWSWQQDEKRTQDENSPGWQNQQRYERNLGNLSEDEFMDHMMRRDYIEGIMSRNQYRSPGGGLPQYPREGN